MTAVGWGIWVGNTGNPPTGPAVASAGVLLAGAAVALAVGMLCGPSDGTLALDGLITSRIGLDQINEGFAALKRGEAIRSVVMFD